MSARLSPAANFLRNSKLFALPQQIPLPAVPPSSTEISQSDSATTLYPQFAAIQSPPSSRYRGDWGFKRALPAKAATKTNHAVVRLVRGIDTPEHTADFESAADHALTLQKFQELNESIQLPRQGYTLAVGTRRGVFEPRLDNTTNVSGTAPSKARPTGIWPDLRPEELQAALPEVVAAKQEAYQQEKRAKAVPDPTLRSNTTTSRAAEAKRWRYAGPSLVQLTGMEFDAYLSTLGAEHKAALRDRARQDLIKERLKTAREQGEMETATSNAQDVTEDDISNHIRVLRSDPRRFGPIIADMLDIPEGKIFPIAGEAPAFEYGRDTLASSIWEQSGPPRSHPSLGLSYLQSRNAAINDPVHGPQRKAAPTVARGLSRKTKTFESKTVWGIAGFAAPHAPGADGRKDGFAPTPGGIKAPVTPKHVSTTVDGGVQIDYDKLDPGAYLLIDEKLMDKREYERKVNAGLIQDARAAPTSTLQLSALPPRPAPPTRQSTEQMNSIIDELDDLKFGSTRRTPRRL